MNSDSCIFCKIVNKEIPSEIVHEDDELLAFRDISPQAPVHLLIIPKQHIKSTEEINDSNCHIAGKIISLASSLGRKLKLNSYRLVFNTNESAGQTVFHLHCHLLAGRQMNWPPG
ncbi:MAG: histidine triad nucleotide-binding protein [Ignavibacteria bacterium]|nr:histidine triad nucleotide-binding protein [Ignavibacteria bacterium]